MNIVPQNASTRTLLPTQDGMVISCRLFQFIFRLAANCEYQIEMVLKHAIASWSVDLVYIYRQFGRMGRRDNGTEIGK